MSFLDYFAELARPVEGGSATESNQDKDDPIRKLLEILLNSVKQPVAETNKAEQNPLRNHTEGHTRKTRQRGERSERGERGERGERSERETKDESEGIRVRAFDENQVICMMKQRIQELTTRNMVLENKLRNLKRIINES